MTGHVSTVNVAFRESAVLHIRGNEQTRYLVQLLGSAADFGLTAILPPAGSGGGLAGVVSPPAGLSRVLTTEQRDGQQGSNGQQDATASAPATEEQLAALDAAFGDEDPAACAAAVDGVLSSYGEAGFLEAVCDA